MNHYVMSLSCPTKTKIEAFTTVVLFKVDMLGIINNICIKYITTEDL